MGSPVSPTQGAAAHDFAASRFSTESSGPESHPDSAAGNGDSNAGGHPWCRNKPINGETGYVMGTFSWPPLSESTRPVTRSSSDSSRPATEGSVSPSQAPLISQPPQRHANAHSHSFNNSGRQKSKARGGGGSFNNTFNRPSPPPFPGFDLSYRPSPSRRGNYGPRPRGDSGPHQNNYGGVRRHQERRDGNIPPPFMPHPRMGYMHPAPLLPHRGPPYITHPPVGLFPGQIGFEMGPPFMYMPPEPFMPMPIVPPPPPPMLFPAASENTLANRIIKQIN